VGGGDDAELLHQHRWLVEGATRVRELAEAEEVGVRGDRRQAGRLDASAGQVPRL
jgi:hypothetical protein